MVTIGVLSSRTLALPTASQQLWLLTPLLRPTMPRRRSTTSDWRSDTTPQVLSPPKTRVFFAEAVLTSPLRNRSGANTSSQHSSRSLRERRPLSPLRPSLLSLRREHRTVQLQPPSSSTPSVRPTSTRHPSTLALVSSCAFLLNATGKTLHRHLSLHVQQHRRSRLPHPPHRLLHLRREHIPHSHRLLPQHRCQVALPLQDGHRPCLDSRHWSPHNHLVPHVRRELQDWREVLVCALGVALVRLKFIFLSHFLLCSSVC
jgi:hypothetical protein